MMAKILQNIVILAKIHETITEKERELKLENRFEKAALDQKISLAKQKKISLILGLRIPHEQKPLSLSLCF